MGERCETCRYWVHLWTATGTGTGVGECHRNAPVPYNVTAEAAAERQLGAWWPQTEGDCFCGEYAPKSEAAPVGPGRGDGSG